MQKEREMNQLQMKMLQEKGLLAGPETGLLSNTWKWIVWGDTCADKARDFIGKGRPGGEQQGKGTQENCSAMWLEISGFMAMGLVSRLSLANHSDSEFFLVVHALFSQDGCQRGGFWEVVGHVVSPFDLSWTLPGWWRLISSMFLIRTSCHKTTHANGYYGAWPGWAVSVSALPLTYPPKVLYPHAMTALLYNWNTFFSLPIYLSGACLPVCVLLSLLCFSYFIHLFCLSL